MNRVIKDMLLLSMIYLTSPMAAFAAESAGAPKAEQPAPFFVPKGTVLRVTPSHKISSRNMHVGDELTFRVAEGIRSDGKTVIEWGTPVKGVVTWRARRNFFGKREKFDVQFKSILVNGRDWTVAGRARQISEGNLPGDIVETIVSRPPHAVMNPGQIFNVTTTEDIRVP